jgi:hypothetical protein
MALECARRGVPAVVIDGHQDDVTYGFAAIINGVPVTNPNPS